MLGSPSSTFPPKKQLPYLHAKEESNSKWLQLKEPLLVIDHLLITPALGIQLVNKITG